jgi:hypothetical protein
VPAEGRSVRDAVSVTQCPCQHPCCHAGTRRADEIVVVRRWTSNAGVYRVVALGNWSCGAGTSASAPSNAPEDTAQRFYTASGARGCY